MTFVPKNASVAPFATLLTPRVAISGGSRKIAIRTAFNVPNIRPITAAIRNTTNTLSILNASAIFKVAYIQILATAGNDTSIPPEIITIISQIAKVSVTKIALESVTTVETLKKEWFTIPISKDNPIIM